MDTTFTFRRTLSARFGAVLLVGLGLHFPPAGAGETPALPVVVLANRSNPDSMKLAQYYLQQREIPAVRLIALDLPSDEEISRRTYQERVWQPLREALVDRKLVELDSSLLEKVKGARSFRLKKVDFKYLVTVSGVPLRIKDTKSNLAHTVRTHLGKASNRDEASVDSELALLLQPEYGLGGPRQNPFYDQHFFQSSVGTNGFYLITSRLDGPSPRDVKGMIDGALRGERYGLTGRAYIDAQGLQHAGAAIQADYALLEGFHRIRREGLEARFDDKPELWPVHFPMENAAFYLSGYTENAGGAVMRKDFSFQPGTVAYHVYPLTAATLKSNSEGWAGPLVSRGAAAVLGQVSESFVDFVPRANILVDRLCRGYPLGDSALFASRVLSWQNIVLGDPLYTPFKYSLDEQIQHLEEDQHEDVAWAYLRKINLYVLSGQFNLGLDYCRSRLAVTDSLVLREKLGDLYSINSMTKAAGKEYQVILQEQDISPATGIRVGAKWSFLLRMTGFPDQAEQIENAVRQTFSSNVLLPWLNPGAR